MCLAGCGDGKKPLAGKPDTSSSTIVYRAVSETGSPNLFAKSGAGEPVNLTGTWKLDNPCHPVFSPDGKEIVFSALESGIWNIYRYDLESGELPVCLTEGIEADCKDARFSSDGRSLIYSKGGQIAIMDLQSGRSEVLTFDRAASNAEPSLSPDGSTAVYTAPSGTRTQIVVITVQTLSSSTLQSAGNFSLACPVYCEDKVVYEAAGSGIMCEGKVLFSGGRSPYPAFGKWIVFERDGQACIGNAVTGEEYPLDAGAGLSQPALTPNAVSLAVPADGGRSDAIPSAGDDDTTSDSAKPKLKGRLVYHNYTSYDSMDSKMYIYDFADESLTEISKNWTVVSHPMNGHFSPDGKWITFMGIGQKTGSWDIFLWEVGSSAQPVNLTPEGGYRDEDPKFSFDGTKICFKRNEHLCEYYLSENALKVVTKGDDDSFGMPYYTVDGSSVVFGGGSGSGSYIGLYNLLTGSTRVLYDKPGTVEYYPITIDGSSFYYTQNYSASNHADQIYKGWFDGRTSVRAAFNRTDADTSDAFPVSNGWLFVVSTRSGGKGAYDLYLAHDTSGAIYSLNTYNTRINTSLNELGPCYTTAR